MSRFFTDAQVLQALEEIPQTQPRSLWEKAHEIAVYLAFTGSYGAALTVWRAMFKDLPRRDNAPSQFHLVAPEAFCHLNKAATEDFIGGDIPLERRVWRTASRARREITADAWSPVPGYETEPLKNIRTARALARPPRGVRFSESELEALPYLDAFFEDPGVAAFAIYDAHLLYADITYRHKRRDEAIEHLKLWGQLMQKHPYIDWHAFAFPSLAWLMTQRHLEFLTEFSREERSQLAVKTVEALLQRLRQGSPLRSEKTSIFCPIFYSTFILEPAVGVFDGRNELYEAKYATLPSDAYPCSAIVNTPGETGSATFHLRFAKAMPNMEKGVYAITFAFQAIENLHRGEPNARIGNVFISTPTGEADDIGFEVPIGEYDVAATFTRSIGDLMDESVGLRHFDVDLCFLPKGTCQKFGELFDRSWDGDNE